MKAVLLALALSCAAPPPRAPEPPAAAVEVEPPEHLLGRFICDACTSEATTDECIAHAMFLLGHCRYSPPRCLRKACLRIGEGDGGDDFTPTAARRFRWASL